MKHIRLCKLGSSGITDTPFDMQARGLSDVARRAISYLTTEQEMATTLSAMFDVA